MSKDKNTKQPETEVKPLDTNQVIDMGLFVQVMAEYAMNGEEPIKIPEDTELTQEGGITIEIADDFNELFSKLFPNADLTQTIERLIETVVDDFIQENEECKSDDTDDINEEEIPLA